MSNAPQTTCPRTGKVNTFLLGDDGTMDTVVYCSECRQEARYNYSEGMQDHGDHDPIEEGCLYLGGDMWDCGWPEAAEDMYAAWVKTICLDAAELHMDDTEVLADEKESK